MNLDAIKAEIDLVGLIEQQTGQQAKRQGSRHIFSCPFHQDDNASFYVFPDGHFKCFGCQEYGDSIDFIQKFHGVDFKGALTILGIQPGEITPEASEEIKKRKHQQELLTAFRDWEAQASADIGLLCRCAQKLLDRIHTFTDLDKYGELYHKLEIWRYHLDVLIGGTDQEKYELYRTEYYA